MKTHRFQSHFLTFLAFAFLLAVLFPGFLTAQAPGTRQRVSLDALQVGAAPAWSRDLGSLVLGQPYLHVESVVVACDGGSVRSFYMTGTPLWNFEPDQHLTPFIARSMEGASYVCDTSGVFRAVNRVGRELWRVNLGRPISHPPVVGWDGRVFIPVGSQVFCRTAAGHPLWDIDLGSPISVTPALDRAGSLVTVLQNRDFVRVNQFSVVDRIRLDQQPLLFASLKTDSHYSYVLFYTNGTAEKLVFNENAPQGRRFSRQSFPSLPALPAAVAARDDQFAVTLRDGRVLLVNEAGRVVWTGDSHETAVERGSANLDPTRATMVFDERGIYSLSTRGATGFDVSGRRRFIHKMAEANSIPGFSDEGMLFVPGRDRHLHVFKLDNRPRTVRRSRFYGPDPEGNYGMGNPPPSPWAGDRHRFDSIQQDIMLARIERAIDSGQLGESEPIYVAYLMEMIGFFLNDPHHSRVRPSVSPVRRVDLIRLLGRIGSRETIPFLWNIFDRDPEPSIKAACAEAIGNIGVDPTGRTFVSYNFFLSANNPNRDPQLLMSAISSIAALCRFSGPPLSGEGIVLLRHFSNLTWVPPIIRNQIRNELEALYREGLDRVIQ